MRSMQDTKIPVFIDPNKAAKQKLAFKGAIASKHLKRLLGTSQGMAPEVNITLQFGVDVQGLVYIEGTASTELLLTCQRCMGTYHQPVQAKLSYSPIDLNKDLDDLPERYEAIEVDEHGLIHVHHMIEDELLLSIPLVPSHSDEACFLGKNDVAIGDIPDAQEDAQKPFCCFGIIKKE